MNRSERSEQAVVSVTGPLKTSTRTFSLFASDEEVKVDKLDLAWTTTPSIVNSYVKPVVTGAAEKMISSPTQIFNVPEATVVTER